MNDLFKNECVILITIFFDNRYDRKRGNKCFTVKRSVYINDGKINFTGNFMNQMYQWI